MDTNVALHDEFKGAVASEATNLLEFLILFFTNNPVDAILKIKDVLKGSKSVVDALFWNNFYNFLLEGNFNYADIRKLSAKLEEDGDNRENAKKIVHAISKIDEPIKAYCIAKLTQSLINDQLVRKKYFKLVQTVNRLTSEDLSYIADRVENVRLDSDGEEYIDDFLSCGLIMSIDGGFSYTWRAFDLVEHGIRYGHDIRRPEELPQRQILSAMSNDMIDEFFS